MTNEVKIDTVQLAEQITWLKEYRNVVSDDRFLEFVASNIRYLSGKCKEYRKILDEHGIMKNGPRAN